MSESYGYRPMIHSRAIHELQQLPQDLAIELRERVIKACKEREPTSQPYAEHLQGYPELFKIRIDGYRAICRLTNPELHVLLVDKRRRVYDRLDVAAERAADGGEEGVEA